MSKVVYQYSASDFPNGKIDIKRLTNQVRGKYTDFDVKPYGDGVLVFATKLFTEAEKTEFDLVIQAHDGEPLDFLSKATSDQKRSKVQDIVAMAKDRADLVAFVPVILQYLNFRNKELDGHIYYSATDELVALIVADKEPGQPFEALLNALVTEPSAQVPNGIRAYEFFIGKITGVI